MKYIADFGVPRTHMRGDNFITIERYIVCDDDKRPRVIDSGNDLASLLEKHGLDRTHVFNFASFVDIERVSDQIL